MKYLNWIIIFLVFAYVLLWITQSFGITLPNIIGTAIFGLFLISSTIYLFMLSSKAIKEKRIITGVLFVLIGLPVLYFSIWFVSVLVHF